MTKSNPITSWIANVFGKLKYDFPLLIGIFLLSIAGLFILYSASNNSTAVVIQQTGKLLLGTLIMLGLAQISPHKYQKIAPWFFLISIPFLIAVLGIGTIGNGAQRWLGIGVFRFQPTELIKISVPLMLAWYLSEKAFPPSGKTLFVSMLILFIPAGLIAIQPDLGSALLIVTSGLVVILLAGISWRIIASVVTIFLVSIPAVWHHMHDYQKARVLTFLRPEQDPLGKGYHIIQSKIALGSGGMFGKGWLNGTQSHLQFLPAHTTDFIFAVCGEELGFIGCMLILVLVLFIIGRGLYISSKAHDTFTRLLASSLILTFFVSAVVNIGMVIGILPVVGIPLPLISFGGSSIVTLMATFGIIMSIHTHKKLLAS